MRSALWSIVARPKARSLAMDVAVGGSLGFAGDVACQLGVEGKQLPHEGAWPVWHSADDAPLPESDFDVRRLSALTVFGCTYVGFFLHFLYQAYPVFAMAGARRFLPASLHSLQGKIHSTKTLQHSFACALVDNVHCAIIYIPAFFLAVGLMQGDRLRKAIENLRQEWLVTYISCTAFWVPYMWFNFTVMPPSRRVQFMAAGNMVWNVVIDYLAHRGDSAEEDASVEKKHCVS